MLIELVVFSSLGYWEIVVIVLFVLVLILHRWMTYLDHGIVYPFLKGKIRALSFQKLDDQMSL